LALVTGVGHASAYEVGIAPSTGETLVSSMCRLIDGAARAQNLPPAFLARLIWQESRFQSRAVSPAGAMGIAQFMPGTASDRGLKDPFDPEAAIPKAAALLADLKTQFGNLGLAAAAYNAGPNRLANYLAKTSDLPFETQDYVGLVTGHPITDWTAADASKLTDDKVFPVSSCAEQIAALSLAQPAVLATSTLFAPWGVQISGSFSKAAALSSFQRARAAHPDILGDIDPMIIGGLLRSRGFRSFYRVRAPAATRQEASALCNKLRRAGGDCVVLHS
jgi:hypothetical protein